MWKPQNRRKIMTVV